LADRPLAVARPRAAARIRAALEHAPPERVVVAPDCGMKYLSRELAFAKLSAMVEGAEIVRREILN
jgi:5-methyltetrahydropteroyltriglutamate--homocysteine methyltransferase